MRSKKVLKPLPRLKSDEEAERFVAEADLTEYDLSRARPMHFEFQKKSVSMTLRAPAALVAAIKALAAQRGIPYQRLAREGMEKMVASGGNADQQRGRIPPPARKS